MLFFNKKPNTLIFEITNRCNLKCKMCDIWQEKPKRDLNLNLFKRILENKSLKGVKYISLTGGEPFMMNDLKDYYFTVKTFLPKSFINISTNGYFCQNIISFLDTVGIDRASITISYDGVYSHDKIRGVNGSATNLINTCKMIKKNFPKLNLVLKFTVTPWNYKEVFDTAAYATSLSVPFHIKIVEKLSCYYNRANPLKKEHILNKGTLNYVVQQGNTPLNSKLVANKNYLKTLIKKSSKRDYLTCNGSVKTWFIRLNGDVFLCRKKDCVGNVNKIGINRILKSDKFTTIKTIMKNCKDFDCLSYSYK